MSGCYGNSKEDRYFEGMLDRHLKLIDEDETLEFSITGDPEVFEEFYRELEELAEKYGVELE